MYNIISTTFYSEEGGQTNLRSSYVIFCHLLSSFVIICHLLSSFVIFCPLLSSFVIFCHLLSSFVILWHLMYSYATLCQVMSSCDIPFTTSYISYIIQLFPRDIAKLLNFLINHWLNYLLTHVTCRGAFAPKKSDTIWIQCCCNKWIDLLHKKFRDKGNLQSTFKRNRSEKENNLCWHLWKE
jgi:hypothetical protein